MYMYKLLSMVILFVFFGFDPGRSEFHRLTTGVGFSAYVKRSENGSIPWWETYSLQDVKAMLEVVSGKFSRIATFGVGANNVGYRENVTYYQSNGQVYAAEAAALINKERNATVMTMLIGIWQSDHDKQMETEIQVALESAQKANDIHAGTAEGLIFSGDSSMSTDLTRAQQTLQTMRKYKKNAVRLGLKLGSRQSCQNLILNPSTDKVDLMVTLQNILNESNFVICDVAPSQHNLPSGPVAGFETPKYDLMSFREDLNDINPALEVMGQTAWPSKGSNKWETIENLKLYWEIADKWAFENNYTMWLVEAIDNPWKRWDNSSANLGWWRLKENAKVSAVDGYAEKIFEPPKEITTEIPKVSEVPQQPSGTGLGPWAYTGIVIGSLIVLFVLVLITMLFLRVNKLQDSITKDDVREFMYGMSNDAIVQQGGEAVVESALRFPYDKSYEISKDRLKIRRDALLGSGEFGCVYKAVIENDEAIEVALKMAKQNCPKSALKGLLSEIKILSYLGKHPNIVSLHGAYTAEIVTGVVYLATELCSLGSLENHLRNTQSSNSSDRYANAPVSSTYQNALIGKGPIEKPEITPRDMARWSHEIACGMEYLGTKHVVHADLATRNVLLTFDKTAKITDFGLSRRLYDYTNYVKKQQEPLPWRWMAIESLKRLEFSAKSDVWSYGVTLWEIYALGDLPYPGLSWNLDFVDSLVNGLRMKCPPHASPQIYKVMSDCWHSDPNSRPTFTALKFLTGDMIGTSADKVSKSEKCNYANMQV